MCVCKLVLFSQYDHSMKWCISVKLNSKNKGTVTSVEKGVVQILVQVSIMLYQNEILSS